MQADFLKAAAALLQYCAPKQQAGTAVDASSSLALFSRSDELPSTALQLEITFIRAPVTHRVPLFLELPHAVHKGSICLITPAPQAKYKELLAKEEHSQVKRVLDVEKLGAKFSDPVALRALAKSFDHFFVHNKIKSYPSALTGEFLNHQTPVWLAREKSLAKAVDKTCRVSVCPRRGNSTVTVDVGSSDLSAAQLGENMHAALAQLAKHLEGGLQDLLSARLCAAPKSRRRAVLPVFAHKFQFTTDAASAPPAADASADELPAKKTKKAA